MRPGPLYRTDDGAMSEFEYLSVLISIVVGLGISHLLAGMARVIRRRAEVRFYLPSVLWMGALFLAFIQIWWAIFGWRALDAWTFPGFALVLAIPVLVYLLSYLLVPEGEADDGIDLRARYFENRRWFFGILALVPLTSLAQEAVLTGAIARDANPVFLLGFLALAVVGLLARSDVVHRLLAMVAVGALGAYIVALFFRLV